MILLKEPGDIVTPIKSNLGKTADLSKLQEMLGPADAKVQKWLADQGRNSIGLIRFLLFYHLLHLIKFDQTEIYRQFSNHQYPILRVTREIGSHID